jgi:hypothetical protein
MVIEPTDEMVEALWRELPSETQDGREPADVRQWVAAVLAIVERDHRLLLADVLETLERTGCQFWACEGPTLTPKDMTTCNPCAMIARLRQQLGMPVTDTPP